MRVSEPGPFVVADVACAYDGGVADADELLDRYRVLNCWWDAVAKAGAKVVVVQRFHRNAVVRRGQVEFHMVADDGPPGPSARFWGARMVRAVRGLAPDVVHVDGLVFPAMVAHLRLALPRRTAIVVQDHGGSERSPGARSWPKRLFYAAGLRAADGFLFTSRDQAEPWRSAGILGKGARIDEVAEGSTDLAAPTHGSSSLEAALPGRPALLWVGRLNANKDPLTVLRGFEGAARALPASALTLVFREDDLIDEVRAFIARSELLRGRVHLRGTIPHDALPSLYAAADLFVLGSHSEGSGYALIEALSFGVTPVVTDIPSFRKLTDGGRLGELFAPGDADALARALVRVAGSDLAARRPAVRAHFETALAWDVIGRRALDVYRSLARERAATSCPSLRAGA